MRGFDREWEDEIGNDHVSISIRVHGQNENVLHDTRVDYDHKRASPRCLALLDDSPLLRMKTMKLSLPFLTQLSDAA